MIAVIAGVLLTVVPTQSRDESSPGSTPAVEAAAVSIVGPAKEGEELIGRPAPALDDVRWLDGQTHPLSEDLGKVVLIRWWTDRCPYCKNTAPALRALKKEFGDDLVIRALYHEKPAGRHVTGEQLEQHLADLDLPFLIGHDREWVALREWWNGKAARAYTSVSFLIDPRGNISLIHTGTEYHTRGQVPDEQSAVDPAQAARDYQAIEARIAKLLAERKPVVSSAGR